MLAASCRAEALFRVGRGAFQPPPAVDSAVVRLLPHEADPFPLPDRERFARIVAAAFSMRRKTLRNSLRGLVDDGGFATAGIDAGRRPETLAPAEFARLAAL
jgi:16S rRNA (adenine1518-N6/adenine1519-N6)-dimethyltransferase